MQVLRIFTTIFICTSFFCTTVEAYDANLWQQIKKNKKTIEKKYNQEIEEKLESLDLSNDPRSFKIRDIKIGQSKKEVLKLYPKMDKHSPKPVLIRNIPLETLVISGYPVNNISLRQTVPGIGDVCNGNFEKTHGQLIKKYGAPILEKKTKQEVSLTWLPESLKDAYNKAKAADKR